MEGDAFCSSYPANNFIGHQVWLHIQTETKVVFLITTIQLRKGGEEKKKSGTERYHNSTIFSTVQIVELQCLHNTLKMDTKIM